MKTEDAIHTVSGILESSPEGLPLRTVMKQVDITYYQLYTILAELGYTVKQKSIQIEQEVKFIVKQ